MTVAAEREAPPDMTADVNHRHRRFAARQARITAEVAQGITPPGLAELYLDRTLIDIGQASELIGRGVPRLWAMRLIRSVIRWGRLHPSVFPDQDEPGPKFEVGRIREWAAHVGYLWYDPQANVMRQGDPPPHGPSKRS